MENNNTVNDPSAKPAGTSPATQSSFQSGKSSIQIKDLVSAAFLLALIIIMSIPVLGLGFIRIGVAALTIIHVPVIIGSILLGPRYGAFLGFAFGVGSLLNATFLPDLTSFAFSPFYSVGEFHGNFWSLVVCFVPRILVGIVPYFVFKGIKRLLKFKGKDSIALVIGGVAGSLTNTIFVLGFMYLLFANEVAKAVGTTAGLLYKIIFTIVATNGVPEAILAGIVTVAVCKAVLVSQRRFQRVKDVSK